MPVEPCEIDLPERCALDRVPSLVHYGRRRLGGGIASRVERAKVLAQANVLDERTGVEAPSKTLVVDDQVGVSLLRGSVIALEECGLQPGPRLAGNVPAQSRRLVGSPQRIAENLDRVPAAKRNAAPVQGLDHHASSYSTDRAERPPQRLGLAVGIEQSRSYRHSLVEGTSAGRTWEEDPDERLHARIARRNGLQNVPQGCTSGPPELVGIALDDPLGALTDCGATHAVTDLVAPLDRVCGHDRGVVGAESSQDLTRRIPRPEIADDHVIDPCAQVVRDVRLENVSVCVAHRDAQNDAHRGIDPRRRR